MVLAVEIQPLTFRGPISHEHFMVSNTLIWALLKDDHQQEEFSFFHEVAARTP
jgi:hypothetical protein